MKLCVVALMFLGSLVGEEIDTGKPLRVHELMPRDQILCTLAVEPAVPSNFIAMDRNEKREYANWVYWGPEEVLKAYFKDESSLSEPIIRAMISSNVAQRKMGYLDVKGFKQEMKEGALRVLMILATGEITRIVPFQVK